MAKSPKSKSKIRKLEKRKIVILIFLVLIITFVTFLPSLKNGFTNWDDRGLVVENTAIRGFSWNNVRTIFTSSFISTYIPLTILSYLFEYKFFELAPRAYHTTNLILHLLNCLLVFWLIYLISNNIYVSFITALLFGIHPLRVESVAWITGRKDVLYSLLFLGSLICYLYYKTSHNIKNYYFLLFLFILSVLAKGMAVTLPFVLLLFDYLFHRKINKRLLIEKIPLFVISFIFAIIAFFIQYQTKTLEPGPFINFPQNVFVACYGVIFYLIKTVAPVQLSALYPYPKGISNPLSSVFVFLPVIVIVLTVIVVFSKKYTIKIIFGTLFFLLTILMVLGLIPVAGEAIAADRYTYLGLIGIFFIVAEGFHWLYIKKTEYVKILRFILVVLLIGIIGTLSFLTRQRCKVWKNSLTLWNDVLKNHPDVPDAYNGRGLYYYDNGEYDKALADFNYVISIDTNYVKAYYNRGNTYDAKGEYDRAIADFTHALKIDPKYAKAYNNRGLTFGHRGEHSRAIADFTKAIEISPHYSIAYNNRGLTYGRIGNHNRALADFTQAIKIDPKYVKAYYNRAIAYFMKKEYYKAWEDVRKMQDLGYQVNPDFLDLLRRATPKW